MTTQLQSLRSRLATWQFGQLVIFLVLYVMLLPILAHGVIVKVAASLVLLNAMLVAVSANRTRVLRWLPWVLWFASVAGMMIEEFDVHPSTGLNFKILGVGLHIALVLACGVSIFSVVLRAGRVTLDGIFASIAAYLLIGYFFAQIYTLMMLIDPASLHLPDTIALSTEVGQLEMIYFSFVTLATVGYGDIVPDTSLARSVTIIEAIVGQFYVAVVVAVLVSSFVSQKLQDRETNAPRT